MAGMVWLFLVWGVVCFAAGFTGVDAQSSALPKEIPPCKRGDDVCLTGAVQAGIKTFAAHGAPQLGILPIDPFRKDEILINQGALKLNLTHQMVTGIGNAEILEVRSNMEDKTYALEIQMAIPSIAVQGDYNLGGRILLLPIRGHGKNNLTFTGVRVRLELNGHVVQRDGEDFIQLDYHLISLDVSRLYIHFKNLFDGNKLLADNMVALLNENWKVLFEEFKPAIIDVIRSMVTSVADPIYTRVPYASFISPA